MLCAGGEGRGTNKVGWNLDLCFSTHSQGDSGGPLTVEEDGIHTLAGITSYRLSTTSHEKVNLKQISKSALCSFSKGSQHLKITVLGMMVHSKM